MSMYLHRDQLLAAPGLRLLWQWVWALHWFADTFGDFEI